VEILARVGDVRPGSGGARRAFEVWIHLVRNAGWEIIDTPGFLPDAGGTICGDVEIEGLRYLVNYGLRCHGIGFDDRTSPPSWRSLLHYAAWAEPKLEGYILD
jgi:hypothetical protein